MVHRLRRDEAGLTLIELIATLGIMGVAFVVIIGGIFAAVAGSDLYRKQATAETVLRSFAEAVKGADYIPCAAAREPAYEGSYSPPDRTFAPILTEVQLWNEGSGGFVNRPDPCDSTSDDQGLQKLSLEVRLPDSESGEPGESVDIIKRDEAP